MKFVSLVDFSSAFFRLSAVALFLALSLAVAEAQQPGGAVSGVTGVKQDAVEKIKPIEPVQPIPPPPPNTSSAQGVNKVNGIDTIDGVKASGRTVPPPPPPPPSTAASAGGVTVASGGAIHAVKGVGGLNVAKLQNLETALQMKQGAGTPIGGGAEKGGKGKAAAAALLAAPLDKAAPKPGPKEDGRGGFQEFEKLQNRGS